MPRFAVLRHDSPRGLHWDFLLESNDVLRTWALEAEPAPGVDIVGAALPDHRTAYLDYEGPVAGGRGAVTRVDQGTCEVRRCAAEEWVLEMRGAKIRGEVVMKREAGSWRFRWET